jgi:type I restriction enzyme S subunit
MEGWTRTTLGSVCSKIGSGATPRGGKEAYKEAGISLIRSQNVLDFSFSMDGLAFIDEQQAGRLDNVSVQSGDVLINITGDSVARVCLAPDELLPARVNQHVAIVRAVPNQADPEFLLYVLQNLKGHLLSLASAGATRNALTKQMLEGLVIPLPSLAEQKEVARTLSVLDREIANNRNINHRLEQMAQAIFKSWFVDFEPSVPFTDIIKVLGGGTPKTDNGNYWNGSIPFFTPKDTVATYVFATEKTLTETGLSNCNSQLFPKNTVFVTARGTVGKLALAGCPMAMNQSCYALVGKSGYGQYFVYHLASEAVAHLKRKASGAVFDAIVTRDFTSEQVPNPPTEEISQFERKVAPLYESICNNIVESQQLAALRDTLLPRLMSGELSVADI